MSQIILSDADYLNQVKQEIPGDLVKAANAVFYIGDTGLDGKLVAHVGGNLHSIVSLLVNAGMQNTDLRQILLITATHLQ